MNTVNIKKNLVFVITKSEVGGAQTWVSQLKKKLSACYNIYLVTAENGWLTTHFDKENIKIIPGMLSFLRFDTTLRIALFLRQINADVVISNSANAGIYSRMSKLLYRHRHIYVSHGWSCIYNGGKLQKMYCLLEKWLSVLSDCILCVSEKDAENAREIIGIKSDKITVINNSVVPKEKKKVINKRKKILFLGRLAYPKRPDLLLEVSRKFEDIDFYIVGSGPDFDSLKENSQNINNFIMLGEICEFSKFSDYDVFILCSDSEGLPMSAIEAAAAGLPVMLSNVGGCSEVIKKTADGSSNGVLFENEERDISEKLSVILENYNYFFSSAQELTYLYDLNGNVNKYISIIERS